MDELTPKEYDPDTGEFIWSPHRGPLVLFGTLSSIWALVWLVVAHKYKEIELNEIVDLIKELGFLKTTSMKEGRSLDEIRDSERKFIYKRIGQKVFPYMDESRQKEFLEYDPNAPLPTMPSLSFRTKIEMSRLFTLRFISLNRVKNVTYSIYGISIGISVISFLILFILTLLDIISDWSFVMDYQNFSQVITTLVYLLTFFLFFVFLYRWKKGYEQSLKDQIKLLTDICENTKHIEEIEKRLTQFILADIGTVNGLRNKEGNILFPYLMFKRTNVSWNFNMLTLSISKYDYVYFLFFMFTIIPILFNILGILGESNEQATSAIITVFYIALVIISFILSYAIFLIGAVLMRYLLFLVLGYFFELDSKRFAIQREGSVPEIYQELRRNWAIVRYSLVVLAGISLVVMFLLYFYTSSVLISFAIPIPFILLLVFFNYLIKFTKSFKAKTETMSDIRYVDPHQMMIRGFFAQYVWDVILAIMVFMCLPVVILLTIAPVLSGGLMFTYGLFFGFFWFYTLFVSLIMFGFFIYYLFIQLFKDPISSSFSATLEKEGIKMMTSLSDPAIFERNKEELVFRLSVLDAGKNFAEKYKQSGQREQFKVIVGSVFTIAVSLTFNLLPQYVL